jgi:nucleotide-binding universal stress UspA family protein
MATVLAPIARISVASVKNIMFATDFSEPSMRAFPYVAALARKFGASVFACHIITPASLVTAAPETATYLYEAEYNAATKELDNILDSTSLDGIKTKALLSSGMLGDALLVEIVKNNIDLVVTGTHGRTGIRRLMLGSAVADICRFATCPVLTIGPDFPAAPIKFSRILIPTDLSEESLHAMPFVVRLATKYGAAVTLLHVLPAEIAGNPDAKKLSEPICASTVRRFEAQAEALKTEFVVESGEIVETILKVASEKNADLIAMGIRNGFHLGTSAAYRVMTGAHCPVVTCRQ